MRAVLLLRMEPLEFSIVLRAASVLVITWKDGEKMGRMGEGVGRRAEGREGKVMVEIY